MFHLSELCWLNPTLCPRTHVSWSGTDLLLSLYPTPNAGVPVLQPGGPQHIHAPSAQLRPPRLLCVTWSPLPPLQSYCGLLFLPDRTPPLPSALPSCPQNWHPHFPWLHSQTLPTQTACYLLRPPPGPTYHNLLTLCHLFLSQLTLADSILLKETFIFILYTFISTKTHKYYKCV